MTYYPGNAPYSESSTRLVVNGRYRVHRVTGVQRYAQEIVSRLGSDIDVLAPREAKGAAGHLWEQTRLPWQCGGRLLWNPCGSGPLTYSRQVITFHDLFPLEHPEWYSPSYARWYGFAMRRIAAQALHIIAVSEYTKSRIVKCLKRDPATITVIHNGLTTNCSRASGEAIDAARTALSIPTRRYVLSLSSLENRKNLKMVMAAWERVYRRLPEDVWLVLAGPRAAKEVYGRQTINFDLPRVLITGYVPEEHLSGLYSGASLFVFPSLAEGFGLPLLEAMSCGARCITSNRTSLPEVGGDVVDYVDPERPEDLAELMMARLRKDISPLSPYLPAMARASRFTWASAAHSTREVLTAAANPMLSPLNCSERIA